MQLHLSHNFLVENDNDVNYARKLYETYKSLVQCAYNIDKTFIRALYYLTEKAERGPKSIYYYKNIRAIRLHRADNYAQAGWSIHPLGKDGHFLSHFRVETKIKDFIVNESISNLKIDFEYLFFFLKNFTNFCK